MRLVIALLIAVIGFSFAVPSASGDEILEAARRERARREALRKKREKLKQEADKAGVPDEEVEPKILTAADLKRATGRMNEIGSADAEGGEGEAAAEATAEGDEGEAAQDEEQGEAYWRERMSEAQDKVTQARQDLADLNASINELRRAESAISDPNIAYRKTQERIEAEARVAEAKQAVTDAEAEVEEVRQEARRAGAPPGWLR